MTAGEKILQDHQAQIRELCARLGVRRLEVFGSAVTDQFDQQRSDFDFLYEFENVRSPDIADRFFGLMDGLHALFGERIDLVDATSIRNPYFLRKINTQRRVLYAA